MAATKQRLVIAIGGNALQRRGDPLTLENQFKAALEAAPVLRAIAEKHEMVLTHGNGPQVGALALERSTATLDALVAESQGQIGHSLSQALAIHGKTAVPMVTQVLVDLDDPAFSDPTKFVGQVYKAHDSEKLAAEHGWTMKPDGDYFRRVVPSPEPLKIFQIDAIKAMLAAHPACPLPIACGGGGVPMAFGSDGRLEGVEAVIDKDSCGSLLARCLDADGFIILTDGGGIWKNFGKPDACEMALASPEYLLSTKAGVKFPGSMGPKVQAAISFVQKSAKPGAWAAIGDLRDAADIISNRAGTVIRQDVHGGVVWREPERPESASVATSTSIHATL